MNKSDRELIDQHIVNYGVRKCPPCGDVSEDEIRRIKAEDKKIQKRMSDAVRKGWIKRASRARAGRI